MRIAELDAAAEAAARARSSCGSPRTPSGWPPRARSSATRVARLRTELDKALDEALASRAASSRCTPPSAAEPCTSSRSGCAAARRELTERIAARGGRRGAAHPGRIRGRCSAARSSSSSASSSARRRRTPTRPRSSFAHAREVAPRGRGAAPCARARPRGEHVRARGRGRARRTARARRRRRRAAARAPARPMRPRARAAATTSSMRALDSRIDELEADVRRRLEDLGADAEAERGVLEARLQELAPALRLDRRPARLRRSSYDVRRLNKHGKGSS